MQTRLATHVIEDTEYPDNFLNIFPDIWRPIEARSYFLETLICDEKNWSERASNRTISREIEYTSGFSAQINLERKTGAMASSRIPPFLFSG